MRWIESIKKAKTFNLQDLQMAINDSILSSPIWRVAIYISNRTAYNNNDNDNNHNHNKW